MTGGTIRNFYGIWKGSRVTDVRRTLREQVRLYTVYRESGGILKTNSRWKSPFGCRWFVDFDVGPRTSHELLTNNLVNGYLLDTPSSLYDRLR